MRQTDGKDLVENVVDEDDDVAGMSKKDKRKAK